MNEVKEVIAASIAANDNNFNKIVKIRKINNVLHVTYETFKFNVITIKMSF